MQQSDDQILATLRDTDRDRYLACLLSPAEKRHSLAALYAFYAEIARIRDTVKEPLPGEIRLQWWRDILENQQSDGAGHPLAEAILRCIREHHLPVRVLQDMIDARIFDLYDDPMQDRAALEGYAGETASALIQLSSLILDPENAAKSSDAAGHAGVAQTVAGLLLLLPVHIGRGQVYLPAELLSATGLDRETLLAGTDESAIERAIRAFCGLGRDHLAKARESTGAISARNFSAFLPVALAEPVFDRAEAAGVRILRQPLRPPQWQRQWRMWRASRRRQF
ncbi:phytoene/squalene synthase family protein [Sinorhizobium prairiense]|uniref:phytoene/squalene synthase family protein n=1 Tax=unclassified Sinorhizobium TaxID=2613772 RepID=UPI0023D8053F|nr:MULTISPECIES: phytoene/squalene synthase family protein [unclassified Sinorhizobium]WEJ11435.1 phytoene/squalene synthase family protein [Sinorhizobium sp. M103]WEJ16847.1 phytoene/squalene synthase family protein [Sinorhizobium sp. K101]WEJ38423.1 phytoene/squalene synthase family protein [Sinorhizobium sp. C101]